MPSLLAIIQLTSPSRVAPLSDQRRPTLGDPALNDRRRHGRREESSLIRGFLQGRSSPHRGPRRRQPSRCRRARPYCHGPVRPPTLRRHRHRRAMQQTDPVFHPGSANPSSSSTPRPRPGCAESWTCTLCRPCRFSICSASLTEQISVRWSRLDGAADISDCLCLQATPKLPAWRRTWA